MGYDVRGDGGTGVEKKLRLLRVERLGPLNLSEDIGVQPGQLAYLLRGRIKQIVRCRYALVRSGHLEVGRICVRD